MIAKNNHRLKLNFYAVKFYIKEGNILKKTTIYAWLI